MVLTPPGFDYQRFSTKLGNLLSSYTRAIQIQENFVGSLFQQNTKKKELPHPFDATSCLHYIHQNPVRANLVSEAVQWKHSSFNEYLTSTPQFCNISLGRELLDLPTSPGDFLKYSADMMGRFAESTQTTFL